MVENNDGLAVLDKVGAFRYGRLVDIDDYQNGTGICKVDSLL